MFRIHIYDVNLTGKHHDGNKTGNVTFKVRKNEDLNNFDKKLTQIKDNLLKETGMEVKSKVTSTHKPKYVVLNN